MTVKEMQEYLKGFKPDSEVVLWRWENSTSCFFYLHPCCNIEHQKEVGRVELSANCQIPD